MKENRIIVCTYLFVFLLVLYGCGKNPNTGKEVILALIGGAKITMLDFNERISNLPKQYRAVIKNRKRDYLEELIKDKLLYQEALRKNVHKNSEVKQLIEEAQKKIMVARLLKDEIDDVIDIKEEEIVNFYYANQSGYMTPEVMRASHILMTSRQDADDVREQLSAGADFEQLAKAKSVDPTARNGGDIGYFAKGQLMPKFENACNELEVGEISDVVRTKLGYHIIKLTGRNKPELKPIEEVSENIRAKLHNIKREKLFNDMMEKLKADTVIEINEKALTEDEGNNEEKKDNS
ncbi:MAG: peptidylprolyl isomerase [Candidatus Omnitrophota bacterium]|nr:peptidylprolyl isomerase [Candidatus Omnitrophota bacterium]MBU1894774.1 peptidylprolyl isomerase [Candidatus Omnitrophota bacterium]